MDFAIFNPNEFVLEWDMSVPLAKQPNPTLSHPPGVCSRRLLQVRQVFVPLQVPPAAQRVHVLLVDLKGLAVPVEVRTPNGEPELEAGKCGIYGKTSINGLI